MLHSFTLIESSFAVMVSLCVSVCACVHMKSGVFAIFYVGLNQLSDSLLSFVSTFFFSLSFDHVLWCCDFSGNMLWGRTQGGEWKRVKVPSNLCGS